MREIQDVLGAGPVAGLLALALVAIVLLFVFLVRSHNKQLQLAREILPVAQQMIAGVDTLEAHVLLLTQAARDLRYRARKATASSEAQTVVMRAPRKPGPVEPEDGGDAA